MASVFKRGGKKAKGYYYASWTGPTGSRQTKCTFTTDKATAERIASKHEADAALRRDGVIDRELDAVCKESARSIESHLADYESKLRAANRTEKHINCTLKFIRQIADFAGFESAADIEADGVNRYAGKLRDDGRAARTIQAHLHAVKAFAKWLADHHKLPRDPLASVKKPNPKADRRRERRMLLPEEWRLLEAATETGPERCGMTGPERLLLYRTAIQTGLRANELRSLTRGRLIFASDPPFITCKAGSTKNRKEARQYIQPELAAELERHIATKAPKAPVFGLPHESYLARMLRDDLDEARQQWLANARGDAQEYAERQQSDFLADTNHDGEITDFHSLRHSYGAWATMTGLHPNIVQRMMRHQSITLTMDTYGHLFPGQEADAVGRMREMFAAPPEALRATGTDNAVAAPKESPKTAQRLAQREGREGMRETAKGSDSQGESRAQKRTPKPLQIADLGEGVRDDATNRENSGGGTRTPDTRIMIPLL